MRLSLSQPEEPKSIRRVFRAEALRAVMTMLDRFYEGRYYLRKEAFAGCTGRS